MGRLEGKTALVTAAGQGIGRASALAMAAEGAQVLATDLDTTRLASLEGQTNIRCVRLDVMNRRDIESTIAGMDRLDILFNCAGFVHQGSILECTDEDWNFSFDLNVRSMFYTIRTALPKMLLTGGSIINMSSVASSVKGLPRRFVYGATKAAVVGLSKAVAADFVGKGIRCNAICPGTVDTPSLAERISVFDDPVRARQDFIARQPLGRLATAEEIAPLVVFLASDESAFITGNAYSIDGGMTI